MNEVTTPKRAWLTKSGFAWVATPAQAKVDAFSSALPAGTIVVSKIHKTEHPYIVSKGHVAVWIEGQGVVQIRAPHCGITKPGTRRVLYIREDCVWTTFHVTELTDPEAIVADVTYQPEESVTESSAPIEPEAMRELLKENAV